MEKEDILFYIVFFVIWALSAIFSRKSKDQKAVKKKGITLRILEALAQYKDTSEQDLNSHVPPVPQQAAPLNDYGEEVFQTSRVVQTSSDGTLVKPAEAIPVSVREFEHKKTARVLEKKAVAPKRRSSDKRFPKQKLRDAIIWSEILAPPVGLRNH